VNFGGLNEWEREKLSPSERKFLFWSFAQAANHADVLVADNFELQKSIAKSFGKKAEVIRYGGDHVSVSEDAALFEKYPFATGKYFVSVSRAQVDNNLHIVIDAFRAMPDKHLVLISNWSVSEYGRKLFAENQGIPNVTLQPAVYDSRELNFLRGRAVAYVHSHSYCGTAPSLVEAMCLGLPILSWDVPTNRETTQGNAIFFHSVDSLIEAIRESTPETLQGLAEKTAAIAQSEYTWKHIAEQYAQFFQ
jgi:glycosyltransferase involved in cell wall biosynthesis